MNARPSVDDTIYAMILTDSAAFNTAAAQAMYHSLLKLPAIAATVETRDEGKVTDGYTSETWGLVVGKSAPAPLYTCHPPQSGETMDLALDVVTWRVHLRHVLPT